MRGPGRQASRTSGSLAAEPGPPSRHPAPVPGCPAPEAPQSCRPGEVLTWACYLHFAARGLKRPGEQVVRTPGPVHTHGWWPSCSSLSPEVWTGPYTMEVARSGRPRRLPPRPPIQLFRDRL